MKESRGNKRNSDKPKPGPTERAHCIVTRIHIDKTNEPKNHTKAMQRKHNVQFRCPAPQINDSSHRGDKQHGKKRRYRIRIHSIKSFPLKD